MATQTGTTLKTYFNTGDKPTEAQFVDLIDSNLNLTDGGNATGIISSSNHLTLQFTSGSTPGTNINIFSGSANEFDAIAPPFVENLQPHVHVVNIVHLQIDTLSGSFTTGETVSGSNIPSGRALWEVDYENDAKIVISGSEGGVDFPNGALHLSTGGSSAEQTALAETQKQQVITEQKLQLAKAESDFEIQQMQQKAQIDQQLMNLRYTYDMQLKQMEIQAQGQKEQMIEDRKDKRTKLEGTQQSEMINQRKLNLPSIDFSQGESLPNSTPSSIL